MARRVARDDGVVERGPPQRERAALVGLIAGRARRLDAERSLDELAGLAEAAGAEVVLRVLQERPKPDPSTFLGSGKVATLAASTAEMRVDLVIFDNELTPAQLRQIEEEVGRKIVDRTQLILDIFARRARTREGKLQVELAQLKYLLPRLVGAGAALSRLGGGIGTRGPGETKLETDRRRIRTRIHAVSEDIERVRQRRAQLRERRRKASVPTGALVGYTNPGKTTLFNVLAREGVDELVETIASRVALDVIRVTATFNPDEPGDRERIARLYRHARVLVHETRDGHVSIVADVPRRLQATLGL